MTRWPSPWISAHSTRGDGRCREPHANSRQTFSISRQVRPEGAGLDSIHLIAVGKPFDVFAHIADTAAGAVLHLDNGHD
jgi:hypothetical protein